MPEETAEQKALRLEKENETLKAGLKSLADESTAEITRLSTELAGTKADASAGLVTVTVAGKKYKVLGKVFHYKGKMVTVPELLQDEEMQADLVQTGSGLLVEID